MATQLWIKRKSNSLRFTFKPSRGEGVLLPALGQNEGRFVRPGMAAPWRGDSAVLDR